MSAQDTTRLLSGIVTGGASGIGESCVRHLVGEGHQVLIADFAEERADALADELGPSVQVIRVDVSDQSSCRSMVAAAIDSFGRLDFAVNNAGIGNIDKSPVAEISFAEWRRVMSINLDGVFLSMGAEIPEMVKRGGGAIVNVASIMGSVATAGAGAYVASKHGVVGATKAAALDYATSGVRVNAIGPGYVATPMLAGRTAEQIEEIAERHPMARLAQPSEVAELVKFLVSSESSFITGAFIPVDGAYTAR